MGCDTDACLGYHLSIVERDGKSDLELLVVPHSGNRSSGCIFISKRNDCAPKTYLHKTVGWIWCAFGITAVCLTILTCTVNPFVLDTYLITSLFGFTILSTGIVIKSWPIITSGALVVLLGALYTNYGGAQICLIWLFSGVIMTIGGAIAKLIRR